MPDSAGETLPATPRWPGRFLDLKERKETVFVATKAPPSPGPWPPTPYCRDDGHSESYLRANVEERLRNGTDRIDLLQLHTWTRAWNRNPRPFEVLRKLQAEGKIRFIGSRRRSTTRTSSGEAARRVSPHLARA